MRNRQGISVRTSRFAVVHINSNSGLELNRRHFRLSAIVYEVSGGFIVSFHDIAVPPEDEPNGSTAFGIFLRQMSDFSSACHDTVLAAYDLGETRRRLGELCLRATVNYPFTDGYDVDLKLLAFCCGKGHGGWPSGLGEAARQMDVTFRISEDVPSWGAIVSWYLLKKIVRF